MNLSDIIQLVILCALIFFPAGLLCAPLITPHPRYGQINVCKTSLY